MLEVQRGLECDRLLREMAKCPKGCAGELEIGERSGVVVDFCPRCRGIWLDAGELEKFVELAGFGGARPDPPAMPADLLPPKQVLDEHAPNRSRLSDDDDDDDDEDDDDDDRKSGRKRSAIRSFLDIFD